MQKPMNRFLLTLLLGSLFSFGYSQNMIDTITNETCACISNKDLASFDAEKLNLELGFCMIESLNRHPEAGEALEVNIYDAESMRKLGEQVGTRMAVTCPEVIAKIAAISEEGASNQIEGTIAGLEGREFGFLIVEDANGRTHKLLWLRYFKNAEMLMQNPDQVLGERVRVAFEPIECYSPAERDYFERKEITALEFLDK